MATITKIYQNILGTTYYFLLVALVLLQTTELLGHKKYNFKLLYQWKQIEYKFSSEEERSQAIANGTFNAGKVQAIDVQYTYNSQTGGERIFITTPRLDPTGFPASLAIITNKSRDGNPIVDPYPSWSWHLNPEKCNYHRIVSVFRVWVDECGKLWVMDDGIVGSNFSCAPQLLAFDLKSDKLIHKYEIPYDQYQNVSWFIAPIAEVEDTRNSCKNTWIYVTDPIAPSLLVYSLKQNTSWRVQDKTFEPNPNYESYSIGGDTFNSSDGLFTVALSPKTYAPEFRKLHYHAMTSAKESWIYTKYLKDRSNFLVPYGSPELFHTYEGTRNQQSATEAIDRNGFLYFSLLIDVELVKWDPRTPYTREYFEIIADDYETMQFPSGLKISPYKEGKCEGLWMFATAYQRYGAGTLNGSITNFRIFFTEL